MLTFLVKDYPSFMQTRRGGIKSQAKAAAKDAMLLSGSQQQTVIGLQDRLATARKQREELLQKNGELQVKLAGLPALKQSEVLLRGKVKAGELQSEKLRLEMAGLEEEKLRLTSRLQHAEERAKAAEEKAAAADRQREAVLAEMERRSSVGKREYEFHVPIMHDRVCDTPIMVQNMKGSFSCFNAPDRGVSCLHMYLRCVEFCDLSFRQPRRKLPSKSKY